MSRIGGTGGFIRGLFRKPGSEEEGEHRQDGRAGVLSHLAQRLYRTRTSLVGQVEALVRRRPTLDDEFVDELEAILLQADVGVKTTCRLLSGLAQRFDRDARRERTPDIVELLKEEVLEVLGPPEPLAEAPTGPTVVMVVGVNGSGKTTTAGKLGYRFCREGAEVILGAADTFRAAAIEQLEIWGERIGARVVRHDEGGDPGAVAYDVCQAAKARKADYVILDTAGRLHTRVNLMKELEKVKRVVGREIPGAPHEVLLVLDATTGQNAIAQARTFKEAVEVTGIALAKLDGTAKGGIVLAIGEDLGIPVKLIGVGEGIEDLRDFQPRDFVDALFSHSDGP